MNNLCAEIGWKSINHEGEQLCGDHVDIIEQDENSTVIVLADGLGSGVKASILSTLTSKIISTMMAEGLPLEECVATIAATLPICSVRGVAYSTFTIIHLINNETAEIIQYDNPHVIMIRDCEPFKYTETELNIGGKNILELKNDNLMDLVSFVFQETFTLHDSIYENIAIGNKEATPQQVEAAAKAAQIHDFIMSLPNGYKTKLGEDGVKLSGGEKQRICIARAILKDSPIIIFDEATSFADLENEHKIQLALSNLLKGKTTIMIAHRLHTITGADQICVFHEGRLLEKGKHDELVSKGGRYADMWRSYTQEVTA